VSDRMPAFRYPRHLRITRPATRHDCVAGRSAQILQATAWAILRHPLALLRARWRPRRKVEKVDVKQALANMGD
jgi:hypothetical protein